MWGLKRLEYIGVNIMEQLLKYGFRQKLPQLNRVCISSFIGGKAALDNFLVDVLPPLDYLEMASIQLNEELMNKCSEKFKQMVVFGAADVPHAKRQHLAPRYNIEVSIIFARDFPINMHEPPRESRLPHGHSLVIGSPGKDPN